tara:strand:+ start:185 stop:580 length:396 start_codon:yes stop_codon:yes gene_type:complete
MAATTKQRYWYIDQGTGDRLAIVEDSNSSTTQETVTTTIASVSEAKQVRVKAIGTQEDFVAGTYDEKQEIPKRFHESLVWKVVSEGYMDPRNLNVNSATFFDQQYQISVKRAKHRARSGMVTNGFIKQVDF